MAKDAKKSPKGYSAGKKCPKCGLRLAEHKDRQTCGKCGYMQKK